METDILFFGELNECLFKINGHFILHTTRTSQKVTDSQVEIHTRRENNKTIDRQNDKQNERFWRHRQKARQCTILYRYQRSISRSVEQINTGILMPLLFFSSIFTSKLFLMGRGGPNLGPECLSLFMLQFSSKFFDGLATETNGKTDGLTKRGIAAQRVTRLF